MLDSILKGDPTVKMCRLTQSFTREIPTTSENPPQLVTLKLRPILDKDEGVPLHEDPGIIPNTSGEWVDSVMGGLFVNYVVDGFATPTNHY